MKKYVTLKQKFECNNKKYKIKITQTYNEEFNYRHYIIMFEDMKGNIISHISTTCCLSIRKISQKDLNEYIKGFQRDQDWRDKEIKDEKEFDKIMRK